jgi:SHS family lactate transporter-like MFS transporter
MANVASGTLPAVSTALPWYRQVNREQWKAFTATFGGWVLDGFDFTILTFILIDIQQSFTVDRALAGALGTVTLLFRLVGGVGAGLAADRWGRKLPLMLSILWFSLFAFLSGFSTSYAMLFAFRALFGIGMGGEWAAGMPLVLEHWPAHLRGVASGLLQGGWYWGYILSAATFQFIYPLVSHMPDIGWRAMFWIGILPALLVLWIRSGVTESPVWLEQKRLRSAGGLKQSVSLARIFRRDLIGATIQTKFFMGGYMFSYYAITFWYPTLLREAGVPAFRHLLALNIGAIVGSAFWGRVSETRLGRRGTVTLAGLLGLALMPAYVGIDNVSVLWLGAFLMGATGSSVSAIAPAYLSERFPTETRGVGPGFVYHAGVAMGSVAPYVGGALQDRGMAVSTSMTLCFAAAIAVIIISIWMAPETRGRQLESLADKRADAI